MTLSVIAFWESSSSADYIVESNIIILIMLRAIIKVIQNYVTSRSHTIPFSYRLK